MNPGVECVVCGMPLNHSLPTSEDGLACMDCAAEECEA